MKPRWYTAILLAALWLITLFTFLRHASPATSSPAASASALSRDVVINEIAWSGTPSGTSDEWIELYNNTNSLINLNGWHLRAYTGTLNIALSGTIPAKGYYLLERTDDDPVGDITADWTGSFGNGLLNGGDALTLTDDLSNIIDTANGDKGGWPAGTDANSTPQFASMERINPLLPDTDPNWATNDGVIRNGIDADGTPINGTPKQPNSATAANLDIAKTGPGVVLMNQEITYTLSFSTAGPLDASGVVITDMLPISLTFTRQTSPYPFTQNGRTLAWQVGALAVSSGTFSLTVVVTPTTSLTGWFTNTATITSQVPDYSPNNNTYTVTTQVTSQAADLSIDKSGPISVTAGTEITYAVTISNVGQLAAYGVRITDTLPFSVTFVRQSAPYTMTHDGRTIMWDVGDVLTPGAPISWTVTGLVDVYSTGTITNAVEASATTAEPVTGNDSDQAVTLVMPPPPVVLISGVLYDGYQYDDEDEAIQIVNMGLSPFNLQGWKLSTGATFSTGTLQVHQSAWAARNAQKFRDSFGFWPDFAMIGTLTNSNAIALTGSWAVMGNETGSDVQIKDAAGNALDHLVYGNKTPNEGWSGPTLSPYAVGAAEGQIIARVPDERTGLPISDTNTAADWIQYTQNYTVGRRVMYPGWDMNPFFWPFTSTASATVTLGVAPDNAFNVVRDAIRSAQRSIEVEAYELRNYGVITEVVQKARGGISVTMLLEGGPVGGIDAQELWACQEIRNAGGRCWFMQGDVRYYLIHAKFIILDRQRLIVSTQNMSGGGMPDDDKSDGTYGSRGYVLYMESPELAARAGLIFDRDLDPAHKDIVPWESSGFVVPTDYVPITTSGGTTTTVLFPTAKVLTDATRFELFTAPEAALRQSDTLLGLLSQAQTGDAVYVEQMYEYPHWGDYTTAPNLRLKAYLDAARRGASVRILLNSGAFDQDSTDLSKNVATVAYVNAIAQQGGLDLQARMGDPTRYGIHSKIVLVKLNSKGGAVYSHVGSINGSETSSKINREMAVQVESQSLYAEMMRVFQADWNLAAPIFLPMVMRDYKPPDHMLISEVYYSTTVAQQWVELYNPTGLTINLSNYKIGDAETPDRYEGMFRFPDGTQIAPGGVLVIAYDATQVPKANLQMCQSCGGSVPAMPKYTAWGSGDWTLAGHGDQVLLLGPNDVPVDVVVYGDMSYPGVAAHPGVSIYTHSLERYPANRDTENCAADFRDHYPTPGSVP